MEIAHFSLMTHKNEIQRLQITLQVNIDRDVSRGYANSVFVPLVKTELAHIDSLNQVILLNKSLKSQRSQRCAFKCVHNS